MRIAGLELTNFFDALAIADLVKREHRESGLGQRDMKSVALGIAGQVTGGGGDWMQPDHDGQLLLRDVRARRKVEVARGAIAEVNGAFGHPGGHLRPA